MFRPTWERLTSITWWASFISERCGNLRPLWRNLILRIWGEDPLLCPCCKGLMKVAGSLTRLDGMWKGIIDIPSPPEPPYDIEKRRRLVGVLDGGEAGARRVSPRAERANQTMEPIRVPTLFRWAQDEETESVDASHLPWQAPELPLDDERILVLNGDPGPPDELLGS